MPCLFNRKDSSCRSKLQSWMLSSSCKRLSEVERKCGRCARTIVTLLYPVDACSAQSRLNKLHLIIDLCEGQVTGNVFFGSSDNSWIVV